VHFLIKSDWVIFRTPHRHVAGQRLWLEAAEHELGAVAKRDGSGNPEETLCSEGQRVQTRGFF